MKQSEITNHYRQSKDIPKAVNKIRTYIEKPTRTLIGLTGGPGSGKSTLANDLVSYFRAQEEVVCLSMDGFHLTKKQLQDLPNPKEAFTRRGAPWTFNSEAFIKRVAQIRNNFMKEDILWPSFDHAQGDPIENDAIVKKEIKVVLVEGLYLLHDQDGWQDSRALFNEHWFLDIPLDIAIERLAARHMKAWNYSREQAIATINQNDGLNALLVESTKSKADWIFCP